ncbi:MAG: signal peptide peptidase SppA, partial [Sphingobacteriia bacterium]
MKAFFRNLLTSFIAVVLGGLIVLLITIGIVGGLIEEFTEENKPDVHAGSVLVLKLDRQVVERSSENPLTALMGQDEETVGLNQILWALKAARKDDRIKGVLLYPELGMYGLGHAEQIRKALLDFKKSKKFVYAYAEMYSERDYYLASVADSIYLSPTGYMEWNGLASVPMFVKGTLDKLEIQPQLFKVGEYKSAGEMFTRKDLSEPARQQLSAYIDDAWNHMLAGIAQSRKMKVDELNRLAAELAVNHAQTARAAGMVDDLAYIDQVIARLKKKGVKADKKGGVRQISLADYHRASKDEDCNCDQEEESESESEAEDNDDARIAIVYANGAIDGGENDEENIGSAGMIQLLRQLRANDAVKAVVLRVNSPGGSALASDVIAREVALLRKEKPVVASFGDVAASGGYYISAGATRIFCEPTTVTGSIGVFGMWANLGPMLDHKLGFTFDRVTGTHTPYADAGNPMRALSPLEAQRIQQLVDTTYEEFLAVVQQGRGYKSRQEVDQLARGR